MTTLMQGPGLNPESPRFPVQGLIAAVALGSQIFMSGFMPAAAYAAVLALAAASVAVNGAKVAGALAGPAGRAGWAAWRESLGLFGLVLLPQVPNEDAFMVFGLHLPVLSPIA